MCDPVEAVDYFKYDPSWKTEFVANRTVRTWYRDYPDQFSSDPGARRPGTQQYFAQHALMYVLRRNFDVRSLTWLHLAAVDPDSRRRFAGGETCLHAVPKRCRDRARFEKRSGQWETMRAQIGPAGFSALQSAILAGGFTGYTGEPDLFCYRQGTWFFAEAKTENERLGKGQEKWFRIARSLTSIECRVFLCRVVPDAYVRSASHPGRLGPLASMLNSQIAMPNLGLEPSARG